MRQKKSKSLFYIIGLVLVVGILFIASKEASIESVKVEQTLENQFVKHK